MNRFLRSAFAATVLAGCTIDGSGMAGKTCDTANDCPPELVCVLARPGQGRTCEALAGPGPGAIGDGTDAGPVYWCDGVDQVLTKYCAACHGEDRSGSSNAPFRLDVYEDQGELFGARSVAPRTRVRMIDFQNMPPYGSPQPTEQERALVQAWIRSDAPLCGTDGGS